MKTYIKITLYRYNMLYIIIHMNIHIHIYMKQQLIKNPGIWKWTKRDKWRLGKLEGGKRRNYVIIFLSQKIKKTKKDRLDKSNR